MLRLSKTAIRELTKMYRAVLLGALVVSAFATTGAMAANGDVNLSVAGSDVAGLESGAKIGTVSGLGTAAYTNSNAYATAAQGDKADSALQAGDITTGSTNGTIKVGETDVKVKGLGSAAYTDSSAYATAAQGTLAASALQKANITKGSTAGTINVKGTDVAVNLDDVTLGGTTTAETINAEVINTSGAINAVGGISTENLDDHTFAHARLGATGIQASTNGEITGGETTGLAVTATNNKGTSDDSDDETTTFDVTSAGVFVGGNEEVDGNLTVTGNVNLGTDSGSNVITLGNTLNATGTSTDFDTVNVQAQFQVGQWGGDPADPHYRFSVIGGEGEGLVKVDTKNGLEVAQGNLTVDNGAANITRTFTSDSVAATALSVTATQMSETEPSEKISETKLQVTSDAVKVTGNEIVDGVMTVRSTDTSSTDAFVVIGPGTDPATTQQVAHIDNTGKLWVRDSIGAEGSLSIGLKTPPTDPSDPSTAKYHFQVNGTNGNVTTDGNLTVGATTGKQVIANGETGTLTADGLITANGGLTVTDGQDLTLGGTAVNGIDTAGLSASGTGSDKTLTTTSSVATTIKNQAETATYTAKTSDPDLAKRNIKENTTINNAIDTLDEKMGDVSTLDDDNYKIGPDDYAAKGNLTNGGDYKPTSVVEALKNVDQSIGKIHGLVTQSGGVKTFNGSGTTDSTNIVSGVYKGNLAVGTTVEDHLVSLDNAVGNRSLESANTNINNAMSGTSLAAGLKAAGDAIGNQTYSNSETVNYGVITSGTNLTSAVSQVASNIGPAISSVQDRNTGKIKVGNTVNANISALDAAIGSNVTSENNIDADNTVNANITALDTKMGKVSELGTYSQRKGNLNSATGVTPSTVVQALENVDRSIGDRTLKSANGAINTGMATSLSDGLRAAGDQIGSLNYNSTHYISKGENITSAISALDSNLHRVDEKVKKMDKQMKSGFASMAAIAGLRPNARACSDTQIAIGGGYYRGQTGVALGGFHYVNDNLMLNLGAGYAGNQSATVSGGLTFGW